MRGVRKCAMRRKSAVRRMTERGPAAVRDVDMRVGSTEPNVRPMRKTVGAADTTGANMRREMRHAAAGMSCKMRHAVAADVCGKVGNTTPNVRGKMRGATAGMRSEMRRAADMRRKMRSTTTMWRGPAGAAGLGRRPSGARGQTERYAKRGNTSRNRLHFHDAMSCRYKLSVQIRKALARACHCQIKRPFAAMVPGALFPIG
jgi:hypothetical protein